MGGDHGSLPQEFTMGDYCRSLLWIGLDKINTHWLCWGTFFIYHWLPLATIDLVGENNPVTG